MSFSELNLVPPILRALEREGYHTPTPIQQQAIPPVLSGRDLLGCAQTGTGKTAAFAVPTLQRLLATARPEAARPEGRLAGRRPQHQARPIRSLILTPTRELALQIYESFCAYGQFTGLRAGVIYGGVSQRPQEETLARGVDILVATPGRLNDLIGPGLVSLDGIEIFTLDEADRMLDMGFIHDVRKVIARVPAVRQTLFFSATMPAEIVSLADSLLHNPVRISITPESPTVEAIDQTLYLVDKDNKRHLLVHLLQNPEIESALVFTRTKHGADRVVKELVRAQINAQAIHGNKSQNARQAALGNFKNRTTRVLVATDIAARGIDIDDLSHVINYDLPDVPESYVHRIGRTGRAGRTGIAISFCDIDEKKALRDIERLCARPIPLVADHPWPMQVTTPTPKELLPQRGGRRQQGRPAPEIRPAPAIRPVAEIRPAPASRPAAEIRPAPAARPAPAVRPALESRPSPAGRAGQVTRHADRNSAAAVQPDRISVSAAQAAQAAPQSGFVEARFRDSQRTPRQRSQGQRPQGQRPQGQRALDQRTDGQGPSGQRTTAPNPGRSGHPGRQGHPDHGERAPHSENRPEARSSRTLSF